VPRHTILARPPRARKTQEGRAKIARQRSSDMICGRISRDEKVERSFQKMKEEEEVLLTAYNK